jgi:hypothetical protein
MTPTHESNLLDMLDMPNKPPADYSSPPARSGRPYVTMHETAEGFEPFCFFPDRGRPVVNSRGEVLGYHVEVWPVGDADVIPVTFVRDMTERSSAGYEAAYNPWSFLNVVYPHDRDW